MSRALENRGVEVLIATTDADGPGRLVVELGETTRYAGVPVLFFRRQWGEAFKHSRPLASWLNNHVADFDVVHVHAVFNHSSLAAACACRKTDVPYVVRPLGTLDPWSLSQKPLRKRLFWHLGVKAMLSGAAAIHYTTSEEQRLAEGALGLGRGVVIPLGIDDAMLHTPADHGDFRARLGLGQAPYVLALSRLHPKKGLDLLLDAFLDVAEAEDLSGWRLVVAGDGDPEYVAHLKGLVAARGATDRVLFPGWLAGGQKASALQGAALMALTSHQENFGVAVVEALGSGVPALVSTAVNLAGEIERSGAGWVTPMRREVVSCTLTEALRDPMERAKRGEAGRRLVQQRFTWPSVADQLIHLYRDILAESPAREQH